MLLSILTKTKTELKQKYYWHQRRNWYASSPTTQNASRAYLWVVELHWQVSLYRPEFSTYFTEYFSIFFIMWKIFFYFSIFSIIYFSITWKNGLKNTVKSRWKKKWLITNWAKNHEEIHGANKHMTIRSISLTIRKMRIQERSFCSDLDRQKLQRLVHVSVGSRQMRTSLRHSWKCPTVHTFCRTSGQDPWKTSTCPPLTINSTLKNSILQDWGREGPAGRKWMDSYTHTHTQMYIHTFLYFLSSPLPF